MVVYTSTNATNRWCVYTKARHAHECNIVSKLTESEIDRNFERDSSIFTDTIETQLHNVSP